MDANAALDHQINLIPVTGETLDAILSCWDENGTLDRAKLAALGDCPLRDALVGNVSPNPIRSVLASVRNRWKALGVREHPYLDLEFWDSHAGLYARFVSIKVRQSPLSDKTHCGPPPRGSGVVAA